MKAFLSKHKLWLTLILIFCISECLVNPIGNFPLNDDWSYGKPALLLYKTGKVDIGGFPAMTLLTHLSWGVLFAKLFGFSFTVLRFSTLVSSLIGVMVLNKLITLMIGNKLTAFILCLTLLFNPIYFNLSNTYMTDVNFNTVLIITCYFSFVFFTTRSKTAFMLVFIFSTALVLIRQFGIIVPLCFAFSCLFLSSRKFIYTAFSLVGLLLVIAVLKYYESYLKTVLDTGAAYKFSSGIHLTQRVFWDSVWINLTIRYTTILLHVLVYSFPFVIAFSWQLLKDFKIIIGILAFVGFMVLVLFLFSEESFPIGNIFINTGVGTETFHENLIPHSKKFYEHTYSAKVNEVAGLVKYYLISFSATCCFLLLLKAVRLRFKLLLQPYLVFLMCLFFSYVFMIVVTESYYDRYHIPLITFMLILFSYAARHYKINYQLAIVPLLFFFYISVFGTRDYLELNRKRWEAYAFLKNTLRVDPKKINGGFEVNCWNEGNYSVWYDFLSLENYDYLIQFGWEKDFKILREYEFQRYFPFKKDKIYIFVRERKTN